MRPRGKQRGLMPATRREGSGSDSETLASFLPPAMVSPETNRYAADGHEVSQLDLIPITRLGHLGLRPPGFFSATLTVDWYQVIGQLRCSVHCHDNLNGL